VQRAGGFEHLLHPIICDFDGYVERNQCPQNNQLCKEAVWFGQNMLLGSKSDMNDIAMAIEKVFNKADKIN